MNDLIEKCLADIEVSNFQVVRNDVCKHANFALVKLFNAYTAENKALSMEESFSVFDEQITKVHVIENPLPELTDYNS
jgi:hypothetical protein